MTARRSLLVFVVLAMLATLTVTPLSGASHTSQETSSAPRVDATSSQPIYEEGDRVRVEGSIEAAGQPIADTSVTVTLTSPRGEELATGEATTDANGDYVITFPADVVDDVVLDGTTDYQAVLAARVTSGESSVVIPILVTAPPTTLLLENNFTSSVGWVKPGQQYPFQLIVRNMTGSAVSGGVVEVPAVDGMEFVDARPIGGAGEATMTGGALTWELGTVPAGTVTEPTVFTLVVDAESVTLGEDPELVWKEISTEATLTHPGAERVAVSHGPKVIPPNNVYETARYGDRPFPVVPVDYLDRKHLDTNSGEELTEIINSPSFNGSTFNLFQEMSYEQLFPEAAVPSSNIAVGSWDDFDVSKLHTPDPTAERPDCPDGVEYDPSVIGTPELPNRIVNGFYQLPAETLYYGDDNGPFPDGAIDSGCGPIGKVVYDAAAVADPEIDYNQFDTDKDGIVDFFMMVFVGCGGNGPSQRGCDLEDYQTEPYDNIWPHSSTLESYFIDEETGLTGYISDDRLRNHAGDLLFYTDDTYTSTTTEETDFPAFVRVGPYNVNPETSFEAASVISHEYGHSLGLPDFYASTGGVNYYGTWNLMAADYSQHMDLLGRQQLGWVIPREIPADAGGFEVSMVDSTVDTNEIHWRTPSGNPYTLSGPDVDNGDAWMAPLPRKVLVEEDLVNNGASAPNVFWSGSGDDFACNPGATGHNLDIPLDVLSDVPAGTPVTLTFNSYWDIEWDFDYGFLLATTDTGSNYQSLPLINPGATGGPASYTAISDANPNSVGCQELYGNGLSSTSSAWEDGEFTEDERNTFEPGTRFLPVEVDLSEYAGQATNLRFSYNTDVAFTQPGWFIDDLVVTAGDQVIYENDFGGGPDDGVVNGGCDDQGGRLTGPCTTGWNQIAAGEISQADHAYYIELRDRTGFDFDGRGQSDRGPITWSPGVVLGYNNEGRGYGNTSTFATPNQTLLDAEPTPAGSTPDILDSVAPNLDDAAWLPSSEPYQDVDRADNYIDPDAPGLEPWVFTYDCLGMDVLSMSGEDVGPSIPPGNLVAEVSFDRSDGCSERDYGFGKLENTAPDAIAQTRSLVAQQGEEVTFSGSMSTDDLTSRADLEYGWDFGDGASATGITAVHAFDATGTYEVTLTVTDEGGLSDTDTLTVEVVESGLVDLDVSPDNVVLPPDHVFPLLAVGTNADGSIVDVTTDAQWSSANPMVASVDQNGVVTTHAEGETMITATIGALNDSVNVAVEEGAEPPEPPEPPEEGQRFLDVPPDYLFYDDIQWLAGEGITFGCNPPQNTLFCPRDAVTRGQMAAFLNRALELPVTDDDFFVDDEDVVFEADINELAASGITFGCNPPDNTEFCPNDNVSRQQMASFLTRAYQLPDSDDDVFVDDDFSVHEEDIQALRAAGITFGCNPPENTEFCPLDDVLREQMAAFLHRAFLNTQEE